MVAAQAGTRRHPPHGPSASRPTSRRVGRGAYTLVPATSTTRWPTPYAPPRGRFHSYTDLIDHGPAEHACAREMPTKSEFPPLLPEGLHSKVLDDLQSLCVDAFPLSSSRPRLMNGLRTLVRNLAGTGVHADLWVDGSFVTAKLNPEDIDVVLCFGDQEELTETQHQFLRRLRSQSTTQANYARLHYGCDFYVAPQSGRAYWLRWYGHDRKDNPKGIVIVRINGGAR